MGIPWDSVVPNKSFSTGVTSKVVNRMVLSGFFGIPMKVFRWKFLGVATTVSQDKMQETWLVQYGVGRYL